MDMVDDIELDTEELVKLRHLEAELEQMKQEIQKDRTCLHGEFGKFNLWGVSKCKGCSLKMTRGGRSYAGRIETNWY